MKLKEEIPEYKAGDYITILDDLQHRQYCSGVSDAGIESPMFEYQGMHFEIKARVGSWYVLTGIEGYVWSSNMFKESYYPVIEDDLVVKPSVKNDKQLKIPNLFVYSKYPIKYCRFTTNTDHVSDFVFILPNNLLIGYVRDVNKYISFKPELVFHTRALDTNDIIKIVKNTGKVKIKSCEESIKVFGHKSRKRLMFETCKSNPKQTFIINNVIFNYEKEDKCYHVVEVFDGTLNLKFLLDDLELVLPNVNNYNLPKDRTIKVGDKCRVKIINKFTPTTKNAEVNVVKMYNRHKPYKAWLNGSYDENTIVDVVDSKNNKFECKIKQLKRI